MGFTFNHTHCAFFSTSLFEKLRAAYLRLVEKYCDSLRIQTILRAEFHDLDHDIIRASIAQFELQFRAAKKLDVTPQCIFTESALEQSSSSEAANLHASYYRGMNRILEICSGIGSDSVKLAKSVDQVVCIESDPVVARMLKHNLRCMEITNSVILQGAAERWLRGLSIQTFNAVFADPSRRVAEIRVVNGEDYRPPLSFLKAISIESPMIVKVAPGATISDPHWKKMFVAVGNECKEQLLFHGFDVPDISVIDANTRIQWKPGIYSCEKPVKPSYIIEPHNAIIRSGCLREYLAECGAVPIDPHIAYGFSACQSVRSIWHRSFAILDILPFSRKILQKKIDDYGFGNGTEFKKRGFPILPETIKKGLRFSGSENGVIIFTRIGEKHYMIFCRRVD